MIVIDYREKQSNIPYLLSSLGIEYKFENLPVGDYLVNNIAIERKSITDYINSLVDGRLHRQLYELSYNYELSYLVIIGSISEGLLTSKISRKAIISSLVGSSIKRSPDGKQGQVITVNLETDYDFAYFIKYIKEKLENYEPRVPPTHVSKKTYTDDERVIAIVSTFPGISEVKAKNLLEHFGTIKRLVNSTKEELMSVDGIGKVLADRLHNLFNHKVKTQ